MHRRTKNDNDMEKVSRSIIYKEKDSFRVFLGKVDSLERDFLDKLRKRPFIQNLDDGWNHGRDKNVQNMNTNNKETEQGVPVEKEFLWSRVPGCRNHQEVQGTACEDCE